MTAANELLYCNSYYQFEFEQSVQRITGLNRRDGNHEENQTAGNLPRSSRASTPPDSGCGQKLFDERGIDRVTMADIMSASGVRASTIYQYFSKKDDIVWAILERDLGRCGRARERSHRGRDDRAGQDHCAAGVHGR